jgi:hypothetical protein
VSAFRYWPPSASASYQQISRRDGESSGLGGALFQAHEDFLKRLFQAFYQIRFPGAVRRGRLVIPTTWVIDGTDSGPMNLAAAVATPAFALFGVQPVLSYSKFIHPLTPKADQRRAGCCGFRPLMYLNTSSPTFRARNDGNERSELEVSILRLAMSARAV